MHIFIGICFQGIKGDIENYGNNGKGPVWWYPMDKMYSDENRLSTVELDSIRNKLLLELEKLL